MHTVSFMRKRGLDSFCHPKIISRLNDNGFLVPFSIFHHDYESSTRTIHGFLGGNGKKSIHFFVMSKQFSQKWMFYLGIISEFLSNL